MNIVSAVSERTILFDGGLGSMLIARGLEQGKSGEGWNMDKPDALLEVHSLYAEAGADVITTNTFGGTRIKLAKAGLEDQCEEVNRKGVELAREGANGRFVAGDIGPTGEMMPPMGTCTREDYLEAFTEQAKYLAEGGVDLFVVETMYDITEALAGIEACRKVADIPIVATLTYSKGPAGFFTMMGNNAAEAPQMLVEAGAWAVGANCTLGSDDMVQLAEIIRNAVNNPVLIQANAGAPEITPDGVNYPETPDQFAANAKKIADLGVQMIGGCCGTNPDFIRAIATAVRS